MADKFISADKMLRIISDYQYANFSEIKSKKEYEVAEDIYNMVHNVSQLSPADVVEVKHGKWSREIGVDPKNKVQCSECKLMTVKPYNYCPHCGARMDGDTQ